MNIETREHIYPRNPERVGRSMSVFHKIIIKYILSLGEDDPYLRKLWIASNVFSGGLTDRDALDNVSASILNHLQTMTEEERSMTLKYIHSLKGRM